MIDGHTPFRLIGPCDFDKWLEVAQLVESPIPEAELLRMWQAAGRHSALCLALLVKESTIGRDQSAQRNHNPLGLMAADGTGLVWFAQWEDSVKEWVRRIEDVTYKSGVYGPADCPLTKFLVTYVGGPRCYQTQGSICANGETWNGAVGGSVGLYLTQTIERLNDYVEGTAMPENPYRKPTIYSLGADYARWGLTKAQADKVMSHKFPGRSGRKPLAIVLHIMDGTTSGSLQWWASGNANASSTVVVSKDGSVGRIIAEADGPWTNGDVSKPSPKGQALLNKINGANPNLVTLSIENEGRPGDALTDAQLNALCWQITDWMNAYGLTTADIYKHADLNSTSRAFCPGSYFDTVLNKLAGNQPQPVPTTWPNKPAWLPDSLIKTLFPEADPTGTRTKAWLTYCSSAGRAPRRVAIHGQGTDQIIEFSDGLLIFSDGRLSG